MAPEVGAAAALTDDEVVEKINAATTQITRADSVAAVARPLAAGEVGDSHVAADAAIAKTKLAALSVVDADVDAAAAINGTKLESSVQSRHLSITIEDPTAAEDIGIAFTLFAITIQEIQAVVKGTTPSVTIDPYHTTDRSAAGNDILSAATAITNTTAGQNLTSFDDPTIPAGSWIVLKSTAMSGTVDEITVTIRYTVD